MLGRCWRGSTWRMQNRSISTPLANHFRLSTTQCLKTDDDIQDTSKVSYASAVGCLMYICYGLYKTGFGTGC